MMSTSGGPIQSAEMGQISLPNSRHERLGERRSFFGLPVPHEPLHAVVGTGIALALESFIQPLGRAALALGPLAVRL